MPLEYIKEMVADWAGAGKAITGSWEVKNWYEKCQDKIQITPKTRMIVEELINKF